MTKISVGKKVRISELPDCYHKRQLTKMVKSDHAKVPVVAVEGQIGDFAVYIGHPKKHHWKEKHLADMVVYTIQRLDTINGARRYGDKLPERAARELFPEFREYSYRL
jgi:hypothetical protein